MGKFIGIAHNEVIEGITVDFGHGRVIFLFDFVLFHFFPNQQLDLKIAGEQVGKGTTNFITEAGFDDAALKVCGGFEYHTFIVDVNGFAVTEPCGHGSGSHIAAKNIQNTVPNFG